MTSISPPSTVSISVLKNTVIFCRRLYLTLVSDQGERSGAGYHSNNKSSLPWYLGIIQTVTSCTSPVSVLSSRLVILWMSCYVVSVVLGSLHVFHITHSLCHSLTQSVVWMVLFWFLSSDFISSCLLMSCLFFFLVCSCLFFFINLGQSLIKNLFLIASSPVPCHEVWVISETLIFC